MTKLALSILLACSSPFAFARCEDEAIRTYDFSDRLVLTNDKDSFSFAHCLLDRCEKVTADLPRDVPLEQVRSALGPAFLRLDEVGWQNTQFLADALENFRLAPDRYQTLAFGYSKSPASHDVWCSSQKITDFLKTVQSTKEKTRYLLKYKGTCNEFCQAAGDGARPVTSMFEVVRGVKQLETAFQKARRKILSRGIKP